MINIKLPLRVASILGYRIDLYFFNFVLYILKMFLFCDYHNNVNQKKMSEKTDFGEV